MSHNKEKRLKKSPSTISTLYFRGERTVKTKRNKTGSMMTLEKALERLAKGKAK